MPESFPLLLGSPEYAEQVMRALGLKGDLPREITASYALGFQLADFQDVEYAWLKRSIIWESGGTQAAVAVDFPIFAFSTRLAAQGRLTLARVGQLVICNTNAAAMTVEYGITFLGSGIADPARTAYARDDRGRTATSAYALGNGSNPVNPIGSSHNIVTIPAGASFTDQGGWILTNNDNTVFRSALIVVGSAINQALRVAVQWREREVHNQEL